MAIAAQSPAEAQACGAAEPAAIRLRFDERWPGNAPIDGRIGGLARAGLGLHDSANGALLWTAGPRGTLLPVPGMDALVLARPAALDLDGDGLHDRAYVADTAGRIWRLDLRNGRRREDWARATLFADLGDGVRGFFAAPDVALHATGGSRTWISIAIGSFTFGAGIVENRFYVLRDDANASSGSPEPEARLPPPLREADLREARGGAGVDELRRDAELRGFYIPLGTAQVLAPSLTLNGVIVFTAALPAGAATGCALLPRGVPARILVHAPDLQDGAPALDLNADGTVDARDALHPLPGLRDTGSAVRIGDGGNPRGVPDPGALLPCLVDEDPIPGCFLDTRLRRRYWLREDAD